MTFIEKDLVMVRLPSDFGYTNTWWRVEFMDNDGTFIGRLERKHYFDYDTHLIGDVERFLNGSVQNVFKEGMKWCYGSSITICNCEGLCHDKF